MKLSSFALLPILATAVIHVDADDGLITRLRSGVATAKTWAKADHGPVPPFKFVAIFDGMVEPPVPQDDVVKVTPALFPEEEELGGPPAPASACGPTCPPDDDATRFVEEEEEEEEELGGPPAPASACGPTCPPDDDAARFEEEEKEEEEELGGPPAPASACGPTCPPDDDATRFEEEEKEEEELGGPPAPASACGPTCPPDDDAIRFDEEDKEEEELGGPPAPASACGPTCPPDDDATRFEEEEDLHVVEVPTSAPSPFVRKPRSTDPSVLATEPTSQPPAHYWVVSIYFPMWHCHNEVCPDDVSAFATKNELADDTDADAEAIHADDDTKSPHEKWEQCFCDELNETGYDMFQEVSHCSVSFEDENKVIQVGMLSFNSVEYTMDEQRMLEVSLVKTFQKTHGNTNLLNLLGALFEGQSNRPVDPFKVAADVVKATEE